MLQSPNRMVRLTSLPIFLYSFCKDNRDSYFVAIHNSVIACSQILAATATFTKYPFGKTDALCCPSKTQVTLVWHCPSTTHCI